MLTRYNLTLILAFVVLNGCGNSSQLSIVHNDIVQVDPVASRLEVTAFPGSVIAGDANDVIVTVKDIDGNTVTNYTGTLHFTSDNPMVVLPADYTFTAVDRGVHTFSGVSMNTLGAGPGGLGFAITSADVSDATITGSQDGIIVTSPLLYSANPLNFPASFSFETVSITNITSVSIVLDFMAPTLGEFAVTDNCGGLTLAPTDSCSITIMFTSFVPGTYLGALNYRYYILDGTNDATAITAERIDLVGVN